MIRARTFPRKRLPRKRPPRTAARWLAAAVRTSSDLADGLVAVAESFLAGKVAGADDAEIYQVVVHAGADALAGRRPRTADPAFPRKRPPAPARVPGDPADPARCHVEDGPAISVSTAQMLACTAALSWMTHGDAGAVLALGRRRRRPSSAIRRAARERDGCRCRFPGCESRRTDLHHIQHWVNGGRTDLDNLISLCPYHHKVVHDRGYLIAAPPGGRHVHLLPPGRHAPAVQPAPARAGRPDRPGPRRGHHPGHDHPALVRRAPRPEPRHLGLLRQRQDQGRRT